MSMDYATVEALAKGWNEFRDGELKEVMERNGEEAGKFEAHVHVFTATEVKVAANLAYGAALKLTYDAAAHFAFCRTCGEVSVSACDEGGREFAIALGLYSPDA